MGGADVTFVAAIRHSHAACKRQGGLVVIFLCAGFVFLLKFDLGQCKDRASKLAVLLCDFFIIFLLLLLLFPFTSVSLASSPSNMGVSVTIVELVEDGDSRDNP